MRPKICACIAEGTAGRCVAALRKAKELGADLAELRLDHITEGRVADAIASSKLPLIATNRAKCDGGRFAGSERKRLEMLLEAADAGCEFVDVEIGVPAESRAGLIAAARKAGCEVILSAHDFTATPKNETLMRLVRRMRKEADMGKLALMARSVEDCNRVLSLCLRTNSAGFPLVAFSMGELGRFTRIAAPLYGAPFTYASLGRSTGPGQMGLQSMMRIYKEMGVG